MTDKLLPDIIAPEGLQVAEAYMMCGMDSKKVAAELGMELAVVDQQLKSPQVKQYINRQFNESGFRNKHKIGALLDNIINMKIDEMQETGLGSSMDIMDILKVAHKFKMDEMKMEVEIEKVKGSTPTTQTNIQNNISMPGADDENYAKLMNVLAKGS